MKRIHALICMVSRNNRYNYLFFFFHLNDKEPKQNLNVSKRRQKINMLSYEGLPLIEVFCLASIHTHTHDK